MEKFQALKGMHDILPGEVERWQDMEEKARYFFEAHGFEEIRTPLLEPTELFARSIGEGSDIVHKQMYTFEDRGGRSVTLRPEMTASVIRAALENGTLRSSKTSRLYYLGPMFRAERPQKGRQRQFYQLGAEILNAKKIEADVEIVARVQGLLIFLEVPGFQIKHNFLGTENERHSYIEVLKIYFLKVKSQLCEDCHYRIEKNVLRVLDCKMPACQPLIEQAPLLKLSADSQEAYNAIRKTLETRGIPAVHEPRLVRGLDYYTGFVFEVAAGGDLGSQDAVAAGGRYDNLISSLGGPVVGAIGFAAGMERILLARRAASLDGSRTVYVATLDACPETERYLEVVLKKIYQTGRKVKREPAGHSLGDLLKKASKFGARFAVIIGEKEVRNQRLTVKDLFNKSQEEVTVDALPVYLASHAGKEGVC